jgi:spiro-SPASM protein
MIVETSGIGWDFTLLENLARDYPDRLIWIVSLDDIDQEGYANLRGVGLDEAVRCANKLLALFPKNAYVQAVRMKQNEERLEKFYRNWKAKTDNVIIQKYDSFATYLPDRSVADLSPLERPPCRHLARDLSILIDGTVPLCKDCLAPRINDDSIALGNVFEEGLEKLWQKGERYFIDHMKGDYPSICKRCDEYHTYNA